MSVVRLGLLVLLLILSTVALIWLGRLPNRPAPGTSATTTLATHQKPLRIGLIPERDVFVQNQQYQALATYLSAQLSCPVQLRTCNSYFAVLQDFKDGEIDVAFLGSFIAVLAMDRLQAEVLVKSEYPDGTSTYNGVIIVPDSSPLHSIDDLRGHSVAGVRTTTAAQLYPLALFIERGMISASDAPKMTWVGTHDDVLREVLAGHVDAGAVKDLRLLAFQQRHPEYHLRRLAESTRVPENALLVRADFPGEMRSKLQSALLTMDHESAGQKVLATLGFKRFIPCPIEGYDAVYAMIDRLGTTWNTLEIPGAPPRRPTATAPTN